jgi:hypothetical protein
MWTEIMTALWPALGTVCRTLALAAGLMRSRVAAQFASRFNAAFVNYTLI